MLKERAKANSLSIKHIAKVANAQLSNNYFTSTQTGSPKTLSAVAQLALHCQTAYSSKSAEFNVPVAEYLKQFRDHFTMEQLKLAGSNGTAKFSAASLFCGGGMLELGFLRTERFAFLYGAEQDSDGTE